MPLPSREVCCAQGTLPRTHRQDALKVARLGAEFHVGVVEELAALEIAVSGAIEPGVLVHAGAVDEVIKLLEDPSMPPQRFHFGEQIDLSACNLVFLLVDPDFAGDLVDQAIGHLFDWQVAAEGFEGEHESGPSIVVGLRQKLELIFGEQVRRKISFPVLVPARRFVANADSLLGSLFLPVCEIQWRSVACR